MSIWDYGRLQHTPANREIDLRFVLGYTPLEFRDTLHMLAEGDVDPGPLITGTVGLDGVDTAFTALGDPDVHAKIPIDPQSTAAAPPTPQVKRSLSRGAWP